MRSREGKGSSMKRHQLIEAQSNFSWKTSNTRTVTFGRKSYHSTLQRHCKTTGKQWKINYFDVRILDLDLLHDSQESFITKLRLSLSRVRSNWFERSSNSSIAITTAHVIILYFIINRRVTDVTMDFALKTQN